MKKGRLFGVGVGPGDPKMMTILAVETIENCPVLAVPADGKEKAVSYKIASQIVKGMEKKECLSIRTPMTKDRGILMDTYQRAAEKIITVLENGKDVAYLTLGDPTIYSTYIYIHRIVKDRGYDTRIINGVPSFCAASACFDDSLADRAQQLHVIPGTYEIEEALKLSGTKVLMKTASRMPVVKETLKNENLKGMMVENCGMENEKLYYGVEEIPDQASYYSLILIKENEVDPV